MHLARILVVLTPSWSQVVDESDDGRPLTRREFEDIDAFAAAMSEYSTVPVTVTDVSALPVPLDGVLLVAEENALDEIAHRVDMSVEELLPITFLLNVERRPRSARWVDKIGAAGAIEEMRYFVWRTEREDAPGGGVLGRKDVALEIGAQWPPSVLWETEHYCFMEHESYPTLPAMLAAYLNAYAAAL